MDSCKGTAARSGTVCFLVARIALAQQGPLGNDHNVPATVKIQDQDEQLSLKSP